MLRIGERILLSLHNEAPFSTAVPYMRAEVEYIMAHRIAEVKARRETGITCAVTGAPLVDAVRLTDDGRVVMEKQAILMGVPYEVDVTAREQFAAAVARCRGARVRLGDGAIPWRECMPEGGIAPFA